MLKDVFSNRLFIGVLAFFVLCVGGSLLYMQHVSKQSARESNTMQDPSAESSHREWRKWHDEWSRLAKEHVQTTQEWIDALPQTPEELERFNTDESYKREVQRQLQAAMDKDAKAYVRLQEYEKTRPAIPPTR